MTPTPSDTTAPVEWLERPDAPRLAFRRTVGASPAVMFLGGFASDMEGNKAKALGIALQASGRGYLRFDYRGHGRSEGIFTESGIGDWLKDALDLFDRATDGPQILVGSSMGGWIALLLAIARPDRVPGLVGIGAAPDFTERLIWQSLNPAERENLMRGEIVRQPSLYGEPPPLTKHLIEDGRQHLLLDRPIPFEGRVRLLHGQRDADVPWETSLTIAQRLNAADTRVTLVKDGDHRLSRPQDLALIVRTIEELAA